MYIRGIRGAIDVEEDSLEAILAATKELLLAMLSANQSLRKEDIASAIFSVTADLKSDFPAKAARDLGWQHVPLMCTQEIPVAGSLPRCIRVLLHWNTELTQQSIHHVYLGKAKRLRPEITSDD